MKPIFALLVMTLFTLAVSTSRGVENKEEAREAFKDGKALFNSGEFTEAADAFRKANEFYPNWKLYYNIGQSEAAAKRWGLCLEAFEKYLALGGDEIDPDRQREIQTEIDRLQRIVGFLKVKAQEGASIVVDGVNRGVAPVLRELPVAASTSHVVSVIFEGEVIAEQSFQVSGGRTTIIDLEQPEEKEEANEPEPEVKMELAEPVAQTNEQSSLLKTWGWVSLGLGGAVLVGGGITGILALQANSKVKENCPSGCYTDDYGLIEKRDNLALGTDILLGIGGAVALAGVVLLIADAAGEQSVTSEIAIVPSPGAIVVMGRF